MRRHTDSSAGAKPKAEGSADPAVGRCLLSEAKAISKRRASDKPYFRMAKALTAQKVCKSNQNLVRHLSDKKRVC